jgi:hypothetical protein
MIELGILVDLLRDRDDHGGRYIKLFRIMPMVEEV